MKTAKFPLIVLAALAVLLAGCTTNGTVPSPEPTPTSVSPSATPVAAKVGDTITDSVELAEGQRAYDLDGTLVAVDPNLPLPKAVDDDIIAQAKSTPKWDGVIAGMNKSNIATYDQAQVTANQIHGATGKSVLWIVHMATACTSGRGGMDAYTVFGDGDHCDLNSTLAAAVAYSQAYIAAQPNPAGWITVDFS